MMKYLFLLLITCTAHLSNAQGWTWMHGDTTANISAVYGTRGVASPGNSPGGRLTGSSWTDNAGNLWLFGGYGPVIGAGKLDDLWKYTITTGQWTWMKGSNVHDAQHVYGTKGV
jgi:hypothetical protein